VSITNTDIQQAFSSAILIDTPGSAADAQPAQIDATISQNTIGTAATTDSGSESADGINISSNGLADIDALVTDNLIRQYANLAGIDAVQNDGNGSLDLTAVRNTISNPGTFATNGILTRSGVAASSDAGVSCLDIGSSTVADQNTVDGSGANGSTDLRVRQQANTTVRLRGYAGGAFDNAAVTSYLQSRNRVGPTASATNSGAGGGFLNTQPAFGPCTLP
jgi:hypothetical protein